MGSEWAMITASQLGTSMGALTGVIGGAAGGFVGGFIASGGNFEAGLQGAFSGALFGAAGRAGGIWSPERFLAHAGAGCVSSAVGGGSCGRGAASAMAGKLASNLWGDPPGQGSIGGFVASIVAGGTTSAIGGGKFENGATTAAFGYLFNQAISRRIVKDFGNALEDPAKSLEIRKGLAKGAENVGDVADAVVLVTLPVAPPVAAAAGTVSVTSDVVKNSLTLDLGGAVVDIAVPKVMKDMYRGFHWSLQWIREAISQSIETNFRAARDFERYKEYKDDWR